MISARLLVAVSTLGIMVGACSSDSGQTTDGSGGLSGLGGGGGLAGGGGMGVGGAALGGAPVYGGASFGGATSGGASFGGASSGGATLGGATSGGANSGGVAGRTGRAGASSGGASEGGASSGGSNSGGSNSGGASEGGSSMGGANAGTGALLPGNDPVPSEGCGTPTTLTNGKKTITSSGQQRTYIIDIPSDYDENTPTRLFYTSHWIGSTSEAVQEQNYYFLKPLAQAAGVPAIFVAPQSDGSTWQEKDHALFDDILDFVKKNLCIDVSRVFATGFSFGGMITYSLSVNHQKDIRAAVGIAPANYNIYVPPATHEPIAWMQTTGMGDTTCPWINNGSPTQGSKYIAIEHATDNGCTIPSDIPTWQNGNHLCYDFEGCDTGYPVKACTFNGGHTNIADENGTNWIPQESWDFFMQF